MIIIILITLNIFNEINTYRIVFHLNYDKIKKQDFDSMDCFDYIGHRKKNKKEFEQTNIYNYNDELKKNVVL